MLGLILLTTGLCGMALEIVLIFVFQGLYGYIYAKMGLIVAAFMLGLVLGAPSGRLMAAGKRSWAWLALAGVEVALLACALGIPKLAGLSVSPDPTGRALAGFEILIYVAVIVVGWGVGAEFPLVNRLYCDAGGTLGTAAAITDATDHLGAAAGALLVGVVLVPVLGMAAACAVLAALKLAGLLFIASAILTMPSRASDL
jgi:spermidine synthase